MLIAALSTLLALAAPAPIDAPAPPQSIKGLLDAACADMPEGACAPLYSVVETLRAVLGPAEAAFCCGQCGPGSDKVKYSCTGCTEKGEAWKCSMRHNQRAILVECTGSYLYETDKGSLDCY